MQTQARFLQRSVGSIWTDLWLGQASGVNGVHEAKKMEMFRGRGFPSKCGAFMELVLWIWKLEMPGNCFASTQMDAELTKK